jgi:NADPH:quinone reductase-like Zn-dependent oxidoreductase
VATEATYLAHAPKSIALEKAAAVPLAALTAWQGLFEHINLKPEQRILINNASGGVGNYAVQLAKWKGAYVIGTSGAENLSFIKSLGADETIDYRKRIASELEEKVDAIFNLVAADQNYMNGLLDFINDGGTLISSVVPANPELAAKRNIRSSAMWVHPDKEALTEIAGLIDNKTMKINITQTLSLEKLREVHELSATGKTSGKILIQVR